MTSSFGSCTFSRPKNTITLFESVLRYRSTADRKKALLHEMIHAILFVKSGKNNRTHGPDFRAWMDAINSHSVKDVQRPHGGYNITTRHDFDPEEPCSIMGFLWKCKTCGDKLVRATNQGPPSDACCIVRVDNHETCGNILCRWHKHKVDCGGRYSKVCTDLKECANGTQLLLTLTSEITKSTGPMQESSSAELQQNNKVSKQNAEDKQLSIVSGSKANSPGRSSWGKVGKRRRSVSVRKESVLPVEPWKKMKPKQALVATEKHELFSPAGCTDAKSPVISTSKKAGKPRPEDFRKPSVLVPAAPLENQKLKQGLVATEKDKHFSIEGSSAESSLASMYLQAGKRRRSAVVRKLNDLPVEKTPKKTRPKQALVATEKHKLLSPEGFNDAKSPVSSTSKKAGRRYKPEDVQKPTVLTDDAPLGNPKLMLDLVPTEKQGLFSLAGAKSPVSSTSKKPGKQQPEDVQKPSVLTDAPEGKPRLKQQLVPIKQHKLLSLEGCNDAESPGSNSSQKASKRHKPKSAEEACPLPSYPLRRLRRGSVASEKNELSFVLGCSNKKLPDRSSTKKERKQLQPEDIQKTTALPTAPGSKPNQPSLVSYQRQKRKRKSKPDTKPKEYAVMSAYLDYYESDRSSGSTELLVNKRTERRKIERARLKAISQWKMANSTPLDGCSGINALSSSHNIKTGLRKDESTMQQPPLLCLDIVALTATDQVVPEATGHHQSQPADPPGSVPPEQSTAHDIIDISDDE